MVNSDGNLKKDIKLNNKDVKTNKFTSVEGLRGQSRANTPFIRHKEQFESLETTNKLEQFTALFDSWIETYSDYSVIYTTNKTNPMIQIQVKKPKFKKVHSSKFNELRIAPLDSMGITVVHDILTDTYYYNIPL